jgi:hypothetical protein
MTGSWPVLWYENYNAKRKERCCMSSPSATGEGCPALPQALLSSRPSGAYGLSGGMLLMVGRVCPHPWPLSQGEGKMPAGRVLRNTEKPQAVACGGMHNWTDLARPKPYAALRLDGFVG